MVERGGAVAACLAALLLAGCPGRPRTGEEAERTAETHEEHVRIVFTLPGDDIGGDEARALRAKVESALAGAKGGEVTSSGYGMGTVEVVVRRGGDDAVREIRGILGAAVPGASYRIEGGRR